MASLNRVLLIGNLTREPEIRYTPKGTALAEIGLAINRIWKDDEGQKKEEVTFIDVTLWGRLAEIAEKYCQKGQPVFIEGRLQLDSWDDKQTGQKRSKLRVVATGLELLGSRAKGKADSSGAQTQAAPRPQRQSRTNSAPAGQSKPPHDPDLDAELDDIPY